MKATESSGTRPDHQTVAGALEFKSNGKAIAIEFTEQQLSPHAGSAVFWGWLRPLDRCKRLASALPHPLPISHNKLLPLEKALAFMHGLLCDARKLTRVAYLRRDPLAPELLGIKRIASQSVLTRFFQGFTSAGENLRTFRPLWHWGLDRLPSQTEGYTLDLDSTRLLHKDGGLSSDELAAAAKIGVDPASRQRGREPRWQTVAGRAGLSVSSLGDEPAHRHAPAAGGGALRQRPGRPRERDQGIAGRLCVADVVSGAILGERGGVEPGDPDLQPDDLVPATAGLAAQSDAPKSAVLAVRDGGRAESPGGEDPDQAGRAAPGTRLVATPVGKDFESATQLQGSRKPTLFHRLIPMKNQFLLQGFGLETFKSSVNQTMREIESEIKTRVRKNGADENRTTGNMVWAEFVHFTARRVNGVPDPHLHAYCYTFNTTWDDAEKKWKAGQFRDLKADAPYFEATFHARFSRQLTELGYRIERTAKGWELAGVPQRVLDEFSKRTEQVEQKAKELGITSAKGKDGLAASTRERKRKDIAKPELRELWDKRISETTSEAVSEKTMLPAAAENKRAKISETPKPFRFPKPDVRKAHSKGVTT